MSAGKLDQRVVLLRRETGRSASGSKAQVDVYIAAGTVWASVEPLRGAEVVAASHRFASQVVKFRMRYRELDATWRLEWRGQRFNVEEALPAGQRLREWLDVIATASPAENAGNRA